MPMARNVWQPIFTGVPRSAARRWSNPPGIAPIHWLLGQCASAASGGAEEGAFSTVSDAVSCAIELGWNDGALTTKCIMRLSSFRLLRVHYRILQNTVPRCR
jgi:hypothetical protein